MLTVTKTFEFCASHSLPEYLGPCRNIHGHNYTLEIEISELFNDKTANFDRKYDGMVVDFSDLKRYVDLHITTVLDHKHLNDIDGLKIPTAENIVLWIIDRLLPIFDNSLSRVRLYETRTCHAEWRK